MNKNVGEVSMQQARFVWEIEGFERKARICKDIKSPIFSTFIDGIRTKWIIIMTFNEIDIDGDDCIGIYVDCHDNAFIDIDLQFAILNIWDKEVYKTGLVDMIYDRLGFSEFIKKDELLKVHRSSLICNNHLTIICTITTSRYMNVESGKRTDHAERSLRLEESDHLLRLFHSGTHSDVVFNVEGKNIHAHKSIIANRSPVFEAMFKHDMREARNNTVEVKDVSFTTMYDLLKFIYSGQVPIYFTRDSYKKYKNLMTAANKYGIDNLEAECERRLLDNLTVDNVFECLNLADIHDASKLKESAINFIVSHGHEIIDSPAYKEFGKLHPEIACEVFRALVIKRRKYD